MSYVDGRMLTPDGRDNVKMVDLYNRLIEYRRHEYWERDTEADREFLFEALTTIVERLVNEGGR